MVGGLMITACRTVVVGGGLVAGMGLELPELVDVLVRAVVA
jgi:hypothetical protein